MMKNLMMLFMLMFLVVPINQTVRASQTDRGNQTLTIDGTAVAYSVSAIDLIRLTFVPNTRVLITRIDRRIKGREQSSYIKVVYTFWQNEPSLPQELFDGKMQWRFQLTRDKRCDGTLRDLIKTEEAEPQPLPKLKRTPGNESVEIPTDKLLPCYKLRPGNFKPL